MPILSGSSSSVRSILARKLLHGRIVSDNCCVVHQVGVQALCGAKLRRNCLDPRIKVAGLQQPFSGLLEFNQFVCKNVDGHRLQASNA